MNEIRPNKNIGLQKLRQARSSVGDSSNLIGDLLWNFGSWLTEEDEFSDIIISTRIRLARNLKGYPFPNRAKTNDLAAIAKQVRIVCPKCASLQKSHYIEIEKLSDWDSKYFVERRLVSPQFVESAMPSLLIVSNQEDLSIMVNEEDHLRVQCLEGGLKIEGAWNRISTLDDELEENLDFSYSRRYGYLTSCPTNIGTGMRVSLFVHLPCLSIEGQIKSIIRKLPTSEIAVRGFYGEGTEPIGNIFQISNQLTLGRTEDSVISRMKSTAQMLIKVERQSRQRLLEKDLVKLEDTVFRAVGILRNARIMTSLEAMSLLSTLRLGSEIGLVKNISRLAINQLMVLIQPAHLQKIYNEDLNAKDRDILRAEFIRENLKI